MTTVAAAAVTPAAGAAGTTPWTDRRYATAANDVNAARCQQAGFPCVLRSTTDRRAGTRMDVRTTWHQRLPRSSVSATALIAVSARVAFDALSCSWWSQQCIAANDFRSRYFFSICCLRCHRQRCRHRHCCCHCSCCSCSNNEGDEYGRSTVYCHYARCAVYVLLPTGRRQKSSSTTSVLTMQMAKQIVVATHSSR